METVLYMVIVLGAVALMLMRGAEWYRHEYINKLEPSVEKDRKLKINLWAYSAGFVSGFAAVVILIVGGLYFFIKDFEVVSFAIYAFLVSGMVFLFIGVFSEKLTYQGVSFFGLVGLGLVLGVLAYTVLSGF